MNVRFQLLKEACRAGCAIIWGLLTASNAGAVGFWTPLANAAPNSVNGLLLLSDGTVMAQNTGSSNWYRLSPDSTGSYVNGTWSSLASMHYTREYFSSEVLQDGRVYVAGGEYGTGGPTAEIYDPVLNSWSVLPPSGGAFNDAESETLPDGTVLEVLVGWGQYPAWTTLIYNPFTNGWSSAGASFEYQDEATWVKLPDNSVLTIDPYNDGNGLDSERYIPGTGWTEDGDLPAPMLNAWAEMGPGFLAADGRAVFFGGTGNVAFYTPTGNANPGHWAAGAAIPNGMVMQDSVGAMMVNGKILCAVSPPMTTPSNWTSGTYFYEFDPAANTWNTNALSPTGGAAENIVSFPTMMLDLPDGTVLYSHMASDLYVYTPDGSPLAAGKPAISNVTSIISDVSYFLAGTLLNGISEGADYGDDFQPHTDYPIVRLSSGSSNYYARTYNWSSTGVMTGSAPLTTQFSIPADVPDGTYSLAVIANGNASSPLSFTYTSPTWVNFNYLGFIESGSFDFPYSTLAAGVNAVPSGGTIAIDAQTQPSTSSETLTISKPMTIVSVSGSSTIGN